MTAQHYIVSRHSNSSITLKQFTVDDLLKLSKSRTCNPTCSGIYDDFENKWVIKPHRNKSCKYNWISWSKQQARILNRSINTELNWYHIILNPRLDLSRRQNQLLMNDLKKYLIEKNCEQLFVVKHVGYKYLHYHFGVGFIAPLWDNSLKSTLLLTPPFSAYKKLSNKFLKIIKHNHPKRLSRYLLGLRACLRIDLRRIIRI
jgi:hypothetical protein